ncbi:MAG: alpha-glucan family phosphorylase [Gemmatimonadetes bacterium]|nr:alpha-glucan family phosphorylase [Gemmatimonadota bacterium]
MPPVFPFLPQRLTGLVEIAGNLNWTWNREARRLFAAIDQQLWTRYRHDPYQLLTQVGPERLAQCAADPAFLAQYDAVMRWSQSESSPAQTWFVQRFREHSRETIAYFCAEFGVHHTVPIYSGGLGVLAGDHCKTASDLGVPLVGVGILYRRGYFDQEVRADGWQEDTDMPFDVARTVLEPVEGTAGAPHLVVVRTAGRDVFVRAWRLRVGRVTLYLLDTNLEPNHPDDRLLLSRLYAGGPALRLKQEWLLGVGGVRVLRALGIAPAAWHANEGHASFMFVERVRERVAAGVAFADAVREVRAASTFTTHTPVPAGHDTFPADDLVACTGPVWDELGVDRETFLRIGRHPSDSSGAFHMTAAAIRLSRRVNAVSRVHGVVTRKLWASLWPGRREVDLPVTHVTNGVHLATWMSNSIMRLLDAHLGQGWGNRVDDPALWDDVLQLDAQKLWDVHCWQKGRLLVHMREQARIAFTNHTREAARLAGTGVLLDPEALTLCFARRFATYKRANLLFHDVERLLRIVGNPSHPVQVIFAGKAHPADGPGKQMLQEVYQATRDPRFEGRLAFLEDYDMHLAHVLVQGADVWLNVPRVPMEASGTSGMKAALNGVPQLSTVDGWWEEGFNGHNGWAIAPLPGESAAEDDAAAADQLYELLETSVVPMFYARDAAGLPQRWIQMMRHALRAAGLRFTSRRMLMEYVTDFYVPSMRGEATGEEAPTG